MRKLVPIIVVLLSSLACAAQHSVTVKWNAPTADVNGNPLTGASALTGFNLYRSATQTGAFAKITATPAAGSATSYTDSTVAGGQTYWYTVSAINATGEGAQTAPAGPATIPITPGVPGQPTTIIIQVN
jgi:hypothetical protein